MIGDQLELGSVIPVRDETSLAGNDDHGQASTPPAKDARDMDAACLRALHFDQLDVYAVERILQQGLERDATTEPVTGQQASLDLKFLRPANHFVHTPGGSNVDPA